MFRAKAWQAHALRKGLGVARVLGVIVMAAGLVVLGFGVREGINNWSLLWRWWFVGGVAFQGDLFLTLTLLVFGAAITAFGLQVFPRGVLGG